MANGMEQAKRPVSAALAGPYGHPYHPILVTVPIGAWVVSLGFDIASHLASRPAFLAEGSQWLIATGVIGAIAAAIVGFLDLAVIPLGTAAFRTARTHMSINLMLVFAYALNFAWRYRSPSRGGPVDVRMLALSAASIAALGVSGYLGGKLTYRYGIRVASEVTQADGYRTPEARAARNRGTERTSRHRSQPTPGTRRPPAEQWGSGTSASAWDPGGE